PRSAGVRVVGGLRAERLTRPTGLHQPHSSCNSHIPEPHPPPGFTRRAGRTTLVGVTERAPLSRKLSAIAESATLKVDAKAKALKAEGKDVISYAAGEPDFATPAHVVDAAAAALQDAKNFRY